MLRTAGRAVAAVALLALFLVVVATPVGAAEGSIEGQVVNRTAGGNPVSPIEVQLRTFRPDGAEEVSRQASVRTDAAGRFGFADLDAGLEYTLATTYRGVIYESNRLKLPAADDGATPTAETRGAAPREPARVADGPVELAVYETTEDASALVVELAHVVVDVNPPQGLLSVLEYQVVANRGDRTYVGKPGPDGKRQVLNVALPAGTQAYQVMGATDESGDIAEAPEGFADTRPLPPGKRELVYNYLLGYQGSAFTFTHPALFPVERSNVLVRDIGAKVAGPGLTPRAGVQMGDVKYVRLTGEARPAGEPLRLDLADLPPPGSPGSAASGALVTTKTGSQAAGVVLAASLGLALVGAVLITQRRRARRQAPGFTPRREGTNGESDEELDGQESELSARQVRRTWQELRAALAALDEDLEAGLVETEEYEERRATLEEEYQRRMSPRARRDRSPRVPSGEEVRVGED